MAVLRNFAGGTIISGTSKAVYDMVSEEKQMQGLNSLLNIPDSFKNFPLHADSLEF